MYSTSITKTVDQPYRYLYLEQHVLDHRIDNLLNEVLTYLCSQLASCRRNGIKYVILRIGGAVGSAGRSQCSNQPHIVVSGERI